MKKALTWVGGLIALYLVVDNADGSEGVAKAGGGAIGTIIGRLQGKSK